MTVTPITSPFEAIKQAHPSGAERWSARDLMPLMGYAAWRNFEVPIRRAMQAAENQGMDVAANFAGSRKISATKPQDDYTLTRFAAYLVAMNGDPNKPPVAAAQAYFAIRTREAEVQQHQLPQSYTEALRELLSTVETLDAEKAKVARLTPAASAWSALVEATGDYSTAEAAKILSRDPAISFGQNTLYRWMEHHRWVYRRNGDLHPYQDRIDSGHLTLKANRPYWDHKRQVDVLPAPTIRVTAKGLHRLYVLLGGSGPLEVTA